MHPVAPATAGMSERGGLGLPARRCFCEGPDLAEVRREVVNWQFPLDSHEDSRRRRRSGCRGLSCRRRCARRGMSSTTPPTGSTAMRLPARALRRADRRPHAAEAGRPVAGALAARAGGRDAGAVPLGARPGRRPGQGPEGRRRRLSDQALRLLRAAGPHRGPGAPPRQQPGARGDRLHVGDLELDRLSRARDAGPARRSICSRANSACSNT